MEKRDAVDAAQVIMNIRPDWQQAGIMAALLRLPAELSYADAVSHACQVAANPIARTPAAIDIMPITTTPQREATPSWNEPSCYNCGNPKSKCERQRNFEISRGLETHTFETLEEVNQRTAKR